MTLLHLPARAQSTNALAKQLAEVEVGTTAATVDDPYVEKLARLLERLGKDYEESEQTIAAYTRNLCMTLQKTDNPTPLEELLASFHRGANNTLIDYHRYSEVTERYLEYRQDNLSHAEAMFVVRAGSTGDGYPLLVN